MYSFILKKRHSYSST